jgi:hypothetical protein
MRIPEQLIKDTVADTRARVADMSENERWEWLEHLHESSYRANIALALDNLRIMVVSGVLFEGVPERRRKLIEKRLGATVESALLNGGDLATAIHEARLEVAARRPPGESPHT